MTITARPQRRYDHRLRNLVQRAGDVTIATDLGVPRSTARGWLGGAPTVVVSASPSTWYRLVRTFGWRRPRLRVHPAQPKVGLRTTRADEMWHIDTTVIRLLDGTRAYLHAVIDNFSRRILAWRVADTFAPVNSVAVLLEASHGAMPSDTTPVVLADAGVENVNAQVDELITTGVLRRVLAFTELKFSNSTIEAWWRSLKHQSDKLRLTSRTGTCLTSNPLIACLALSPRGAPARGTPTHAHSIPSSRPPRNEACHRSSPAGSPRPGL